MGMLRALNSLPFRAAFGLLLHLAVFSLVAQAQSPWGRLRGTVQDSSGARIAGAKIFLTRAGTAERRRAISDDRGEFQIGNLVPGAYQVRVSSTGFAEARSEVKVVISSTQEIAVRLQPLVSGQTVTVHGAASSITLQPLNTASAIEEGTVTARDLETFPLAHRSFANIAYLA